MSLSTGTWTLARLYPKTSARRAHFFLAYLCWEPQGRAVGTAGTVARLNLVAPPGKARAVPGAGGPRCPPRASRSSGRGSQPFPAEPLAPADAVSTFPPPLPSKYAPVGTGGLLAVEGGPGGDRGAPAKGSRGSRAPRPAVGLITNPFPVLLSSRARINGARTSQVPPAPPDPALTLSPGRDPARDEVTSPEGSVQPGECPGYGGRVGPRVGQSHTLGAKAAPHPSPLWAQPGFGGGQGLWRGLGVSELRPRSPPGTPGSVLPRLGNPSGKAGCFWGITLRTLRGIRVAAGLVWGAGGASSLPRQCQLRSVPSLPSAGSW